MIQSPNTPTDPNTIRPEEPGGDAAQQSLSDALRTSFVVLKLLMIALLVIYLSSGVFRVKENEIGVRFRFGKKIDTHQRGWHVGWPFPIDQLIIVPGNVQTARIDTSFWYDNPENQTPEQLAGKTLDPLVDSFLITSDGNVVHAQFSVEYEINPNQIESYLQNVGTIERAHRIVRTASERGMIHSIASRSIEDVINKRAFNKAGSDIIKSNIQQLLTDLDTGILVRNILVANENQSMPNQIREAYEEVTRAQADKVKTIQEARQTYEATLGGTAGPAHPELFLMTRAYEAALANKQTALATALRHEITRSIKSLRLPQEDVINQIQAYRDAATQLAGSNDAGQLAHFNKISLHLSKTMTELPEKRLTGKPITGEIATAISRSRTMRSDIATRARLGYERYASALDTFKKAPLVFANDRLQATRETVMGGDVLVQTFIGEVDNLRLDTNLDPEGQEEIAKAGLLRRREKASSEKENE